MSGERQTELHQAEPRRPVMGRSGHNKLRAAARVQCAVEGHAWGKPVQTHTLVRQTCDRCGYMDYPSKRECEARGFMAGGQ